MMISLLVLLCISKFVLSNTVFSTTIEKCTLRDKDIGLECNTKLSLIAKVSYGLSATVDAVTYSEIERDDGTKTALQETMQIEITTLPPILYYPLIYLHRVPYGPYEEVIKIQNAFPGIAKCDAAETSTYPTCGWTYVGSYQIPDSQGFCCNKAWAMLTEQAWWRGEILLGEQSNIVNSFSTAHCMRLGDLYFYGYTIHEPIMSMAIEVKVTKGEKSFKLVVSPENVIDTTYQKSNFDPESDVWMYSKLVGSYDSYTSPPELGNEVIYIPSSPSYHEFVLNYQTHMIMLQREHVTWDGSDCNRVGVGFEVFRGEKGKCESSTSGDCLHNQLVHYYWEDMGRIGSNPESFDAHYLVHGMKQFKGGMEFVTGMEKTLKYRVEEYKSSEVQIIMDMADIRLVVTESVGIIVEAWVEDFDSMSTDGTMVVVVQNMGDFKTDYIIQVNHCNMQILFAIPSQMRTLSPGQRTDMKFNIYTNYNLNTKNSCLVSLLSPEDKLYDSVEVLFDTFKHRSDFSWDLQMKNEESVGTKDGFSLGGCPCPWYDFPCYFVNFTSCWLNILILILILICIILCLCFCIIFFLSGGHNYLGVFGCGILKAGGLSVKGFEYATKSTMKATSKGVKGTVGMGAKGMAVGAGAVGMAGVLGTKKKPQGGLKMGRYKEYVARRKKKMKVLKDKRMKKMKVKREIMKKKRAQKHRQRMKERHKQRQLEDRLAMMEQRLMSGGDGGGDGGGSGSGSGVLGMAVAGGAGFAGGAVVGAGAGAVAASGRRRRRRHGRRRHHHQSKDGGEKGKDGSRRRHHHGRRRRRHHHGGRRKGYHSDGGVMDRQGKDRGRKKKEIRSEGEGDRDRDRDRRRRGHDDSSSGRGRGRRRRKDEDEEKEEGRGRRRDDRDDRDEKKKNKKMKKSRSDIEEEREIERSRIEKKNYPVPTAPPGIDRLKRKELKTFAREHKKCYLNVNTNTLEGKKIYDLVCKCMPLEIGPNFCMMGVLIYQKRKDRFIFIISKTAMKMYWKYDQDKLEWDMLDKGVEIGKAKRAYMLPEDENGVVRSISKVPWIGHIIINNEVKNEDRASEGEESDLDSDD